jgi:hypothetical protein
MARAKGAEQLVDVGDGFRAAAEAAMDVMAPDEGSEQ